MHMHVEGPCGPPCLRRCLCCSPHFCAHQASLPSTLLCLPAPHRSTGTAELGRHSQPSTGSGELSTSLCVPQQALLQARKLRDLE